MCNIFKETFFILCQRRSIFLVSLMLHICSSVIAIFPYHSLIHMFVTFFMGLSNPLRKSSVVYNGNWWAVSALFVETAVLWWLILEAKQIFFSRKKLIAKRQGVATLPKLKVHTFLPTQLSWKNQCGIFIKITSVWTHVPQKSAIC